MALIVEDGSMVAGAESYASVAYANSYHALLGNDAWSDLDLSVKEQCLRKATAYMQGKYFALWQGEKRVYTQALDWPRNNVGVFGTNDLYPNNIIPNEIKNACCLLANKSAVAPLVTDKERLVKREKVDVLETEYSEFDSDQVVYREIDLMLARYFGHSGTSGALKIVRV